jgi:uncharacterized protein YecE (DUF72 family)
MTQYRIGCSGFYNKHWKGIFYPIGMAQQHWFGFYCEHFNSLEINVTFYRFPKQDVLQGWWIKSPEDFKFSVKAPRAITHLRKFNDCERLLFDFYDACEKGLKNKLSTLLFQLPPTIHFSEEKLEKICRSLNPDFKNIVEFRHESWWNPQVYEILKSYNIIFCSVSHPKLPGDIVVNSPTAYVRLHGVPEMFYSEYSHEHLQKLMDTLKAHNELEGADIFFNNTAGNAGVLNASELKSMVDRKS